MIALLAQVQLPGEVEGIRRQFTQNVTFVQVMTAVLVILGIILAPYAINYFVKRARRDVDSPSRLFRSLLRRLPLSLGQRLLLHRVADGLGLAHPTTLLLSESLYENLTQRWTKESGSVDTADLDAVRRILFPGPTSTPEIR